MNQRDKMTFLLGQLESIKYPFIWTTELASQAYYDLIDSIVDQYKSIMKDVYPDFEGD